MGVADTRRENWEAGVGGEGTDWQYPPPPLKGRHRMSQEDPDGVDGSLEWGSGRRCTWTAHMTAPRGRNPPSPPSADIPGPYSELPVAA